MSITRFTTHLKTAFPWLLATIVVLSGGVYTYNVWRDSAAQYQQNFNDQFQDATDIVANNIQSRFKTYTVIMRGVQGFYMSSEDISREEFRQYIQSMLAQEDLPGVQGIGYSVVVQDAEREEHIAKVRAELPDYDIHPAGERALYVPILRMEPNAKKNETVFGLDTLTKSAAKDAMIASLNSGDMRITERLVLHQDINQPDSYGFVMYLPIFKKDAKPAQPNQAPQTVKTLPVDEASQLLLQHLPMLKGWVDVPFRMNELIEGLKGEFDQGMLLKIYDGATPSAEKLMYAASTDRSAPWLQVGNTNSAAINPSLYATRLLDIGGREWLLEINGLETFHAADFAEPQPRLLAITGAAVTLLLGLLVYLLANRFKQVETQFSELFNRSNDGILIFNHAHQFSNANPAALKKLGYDNTSITHAHVADVISPNNQPAIDAKTLLSMAESSVMNELWLQTQSGQPFAAEMHVNKLSHQQYFAVFRDLTDRIKNEAQLQLNAQVFEASIEGILITDHSFVVQSANSAYMVMKNISAEAIIGSALQTSLFADQTSAFYVSVTAMLQDVSRWQGEINGTNSQGEPYALWISISSIRDKNQKISHYVVTMNDITHYKEAQAKISYLSHFNNLTGLPNRHLLKERATNTIAACQKNHATFALILIDLDRFKVINDSLGIAIGDSVLKKVAERLNEVLHLEDTACHQGSDEFMVLLPNTNAEQAKHLCKALLDLLSGPIAVDEKSITITACLGVAMYPQDGLDFDNLMQSAEAAMFKAKKRGRNNIQFFAPEMHHEASMTFQIENELREALAQNQFMLDFQPQVDARTYQIIGFEALVRWRHPVRGIVPPMQFIPIAEETGLIADIGAWVLNEALRQQKAWGDAGLSLVPVAVNLSVIQFRQPEFYQDVLNAITKHGVAPELLELELTESIAMEDSDFTIAILNKFHALGVKLSIDDFGTGYSSLNYLKRFKIDKLKIDQSFVRDLSTRAATLVKNELESEDSAIITAIIHLAKALGFQTIAEGVETPQQLAFLQTKQCDQIQGYLFSKPVSAETCANLLKFGAMLPPQT